MHFFFFCTYYSSLILFLQSECTFYFIFFLVLRKHSKMNVHDFDMSVKLTWPILSQFCLGWGGYAGKMFSTHLANWYLYFFTLKTSKKMKFFILKLISNLLQRQAFSVFSKYSMSNVPIHVFAMTFQLHYLVFASIICAACSCSIHSCISLSILQSDQYL